MKRFLQVVIALVMIWLIVWNIDQKALVDAFSKYRLKSICIGVVLFFLSCSIAASKWRLLWRKATWREMLIANFTSQFYSTVLPGQLAGEVVKTLLVGHRFSDITGVAASVLIDRVTGFVALLIVAVIGALLSNSTVAESTVLPLVFITIGLFCALYLIGSPWVFKPMTSILDWLGRKNDRLNTASKKVIVFISAWKVLASQPRLALAAIALGIAYQFLAVCINLTIANDLGIDVSFSDWCWVYCLLSIALLLPITIAGIGIREGTYAGLLSLFGVPLEKAVAVSIVVFAITLIGALIGAIMELAKLSGAHEQT